MKFLVGVDGSDAAKAAIDCVIRLARPDVDQIEILHYDTPSSADLEEISRQDESARILVKSMEKHVSEAGISVSASLARGDPKTGLCEAAVTHSSDVIVVGARGVGMLQSVVFGSVSSSVLANTDRPTLVVKKHISETPHRRYIYCHDGMHGTSDAAFSMLLSLAKPNDVVLCVAVLERLKVTTGMQLLTGCDPNMGDIVDEVNDSNAARISQDLDRCVRTCTQHQLVGSAMFKVGEPEAILLDVCASYLPDIVVVGSKKRGALQRLVLGSISTTLVHHAPCAAMLVVNAVPDTAH
jgi:nucleotide-binding universal stress UspA family protein